MRVLRWVPLGAVCLLWTLLSVAAPVVDEADANRDASTAEAAPPALRAALQQVWQTSPAVQAARAERDAARARAEAAARPLYNPELELVAENADVQTRTAGLSLTLDVSGKRRARASRGDAERQAGEAAYALQRRDVAARWLGAWSGAALAARQVALGDAQLALMQRFDTLAAQRLKVGDVSSPERDLAALALAETRIQQATLLGDEAAARATLLAIGGGSADTLPALPETLPPTADAYAARATEWLPPSAQARAEQAVADAGVTEARRARVPDPTLSLVGGRVRSGPVSDQVIGLSLSIPLPLLDNGSATLRAAHAEANAASARLQAAEQAAHAAVMETQARYAALRPAAEILRHSRAGAFEARAELLEKLWRAGEINTSDYLVQLKQSLDTALSGLELESRVWQAWFDYLAAAGRLTDWIDGRTLETSR